MGPIAFDLPASGGAPVLCELLVGSYGDAADSRRSRGVVVDPEEGWSTREIPLHRPSGLVSDGRRLIAISGSKVVEVDTGTGATTDLLTSHLAAPIGLAVDAGARLEVGATVLPCAASTSSALILSS